MANFNRKTFDPVNIEYDIDRLKVLRRIGEARYNNFHYHKKTNFKEVRYPNTYYWFRGMALESIHNEIDEKLKKGEELIFLDAGCGDSADCEVVLLEGFKQAYAIDLFLPYYEHKGVDFIQGDICEESEIKEETIDYAVSQAVLDLMSRSDRDLFYKEMFRVLKWGGRCSVFIQKLKDGRDQDAPPPSKAPARGSADRPYPASAG